MTYSDILQLFALLATASSCVLIGSFLVLREMTMVANALSHTTLLGLVASVYLSHSSFPHTGQLFLSACITALLTTVLIECCEKFFSISADASIALVFTTLFACGVIGATVLTRSTHLGTEALMGNLDALHPDDLIPCFVVLLANVFITTLSYQRYHLLSFDADYAQSIGWGWALSQLMVAQAALTIVSAMRIMGLVLVLALLIAPIHIALPWCSNLAQLLRVATAASFVCSFLAVFGSRWLLSSTGTACSTSGLLVVILGIALSVSLHLRSQHSQKVKRLDQPAKAR